MMFGVHVNHRILQPKIIQLDFIQLCELGKCIELKTRPQILSHCALLSNPQSGRKNTALLPQINLPKLIGSRCDECYWRTGHGRVGWLGGPPGRHRVSCLGSWIYLSKLHPSKKSKKKIHILLQIQYQNYFFWILFWIFFSIFTKSKRIKKICFSILF